MPQPTRQKKTTFRMWLDTLADALVNMSGRGFNPDACPLPAFKPKQENRAALPKKEKRPVEVRDDGLLTDDEMLNWRYYGYGDKGRERVEAATKDTRTSRAVEVDFDEMPVDSYGITEREYGEMKAYNPPLGNLKLAAQVKAMKAKGDTLAEIAAQLGQAEMTIRHYSSALFKASPIKKKGK